MLEEAVASCLVADVPIGAFLSGGLDSSAVVALMSKHLGRRVDSVTVSYADSPGNDESSYTSAVAEHVGANLHHVVIREGDALDALSGCLHHLDEPLADPACINTFIASRRLRELGVPVALVGEGADELFLGYPSYFKHQRLAPLWRWRDRVPTSLRLALYGSMAPLLGPLGLDGHRDLVRRAASDESLFVSSDLSFPDADKLKLAGPALAREIRRHPASRHTERARAELGPHGRGDSLALMGFGEVRLRMAEQLLMRVDKLSMAHSIEVRAPFLNKHLARYAISLTSAVRTLNGQPKGLLRRAVADLLPPITLARSKMGFSTPAKHWFRGAFGDRLRDTAQRSDLITSNTIAGAQVDRLLAEHQTGRRRHHPKLWNLLCLLEWYQGAGITGIGETADPRELAPA